MDKKPKAWAEWTTVEIRVLEEIWASNEPLKTNMHRLPRHTVAAAHMKGQGLGFPARHNVKSEYSAAYSVLKMALESTPDHGKSLAGRTGVSYRRVQDFLREMHAAARIHITGWRKTARNGPPFPIYAWGEGDDVRKPKPSATRKLIGQRDSARNVANPFGQLIAYATDAQRRAA